MFLDIAPTAGGAAIFAAVAFFLIFAGVAFFAYRMLRRTVKTAFRMAVVGVILAIAAAGSIAIWAISGPAVKPRPTRQR